MNGVVPALECHGLTKTFAGRPALSGVDISIAAGEIRAVLGENGSGKSTLVKIIAGYHHPDPGSDIRVGGQVLQHGVSAASAGDAARRAGARFVHQDLGLVDSLSVQDNLCFGPGFPTSGATIRPKALRERARADLARVGLDLDPRRPVGGLLPAEKTGVAVARALSASADTDIHLLVLDEPTATLPVREVEFLLRMVRSVAQGGIGVLYISHHLDEVFEVADSVTVLRDGKVVAQADTAALTRAQLVTHLLGAELLETGHQAELPAEATRHAVLSADGISAGQLDHLDLQVAAGEIVGIAGLTGSGREVVCSAVFGGVPRRAGTVAVSGARVRSGRTTDAIRAGAGYIPADRKQGGLFLDMTCEENLTISDLRPYWRRALLRRSGQKREAVALFDEFDVRPREAVREPVRTLSGGNQQKVLFAKWLRRDPKLLLLDEPTQGVDLGARSSIHRQIVAAAGRGAAVVISSADLDELAAICHRVLIIRDGRVVDVVPSRSLSATALSRAILGSAS